MWDFDHPPLAAALAARYQVDWMLPSECADRLASGAAEHWTHPHRGPRRHAGLRILPGCTIASKGRVRSLLLVRRANRPLAALRTVAADTASRTTLAYARILFHKWGNPGVPFLPWPADLDVMLDKADAAIVIGDPALLALEERANRFERTGEELVYHDMPRNGAPSPACPSSPPSGALRAAAFWTRMSRTTSSAPATTAFRTSRLSWPSGRPAWPSLKKPSPPT